MAERVGQLRILIVDDDDMLLSELQAFAFPAVEFTTISPATVSASKGAFADRHIVVVGVDTSGGLDLVSDLCGRAGMPPVVALGARGTHRKSLEHILLLAERVARRCRCPSRSTLWN